MLAGCKCYFEQEQESEQRRLAGGKKSTRRVGARRVRRFAARMCSSIATVALSASAENGLAKAGDQSSATPGSRPACRERNRNETGNVSRAGALINTSRIS